MITAQSIIDGTKDKLITLILSLMRKLTGYLETGKKNLEASSFPMVIRSDQFSNAPSTIKTGFLSCPDGKRGFAWSPGRDYTDLSDLSVNELYEIAVALENTYNSK